MSRNALTGVTPGLWRNKRATQTRIYVTERASQRDLSDSQVVRLARRHVHCQNPCLARPRRTQGLRSGSMGRFWS